MEGVSEEFQVMENDKSKMFLGHKDQFKKLSLYNIFIQGAIILFVLFCTFIPFFMCTESIMDVQFSTLEAYSNFIKTLSEEEIVKGVYKRPFSIWEDLLSLMKGFGEIEGNSKGELFLFLFEETITFIFGVATIIMSGLLLYNLIKEYDNEDIMLVKYNEYKSQSIVSGLKKMNVQRYLIGYISFFLFDLIVPFLFVDLVSASSKKYGCMTRLAGVNGWFLIPLIVLIGIIVLSVKRDKDEKEVKVMIIKENN